MRILITSIYVLLFISLSSIRSYSQILKIDNGLTYSFFSNKERFDVLNSGITNYSVMAGVDYLDKKHFFLSSQTGFMKIGGKEYNDNIPDEYSELRYAKESKSYIHVNTTIRAYETYAQEKGRLFIGIGPYINILLGSKDFVSSSYKSELYYKKINAGGKAEIGATYDINKLRIGFTGIYMLSILKPTTSGFEINNNVLSGMVTIGYRLN